MFMVVIPLNIESIISYHDSDPPGTPPTDLSSQTVNLFLLSAIFRKTTPFLSIIPTPHYPSPFHPDSTRVKSETLNGQTFKRDVRAAKFHSSWSADFRT
jgi:hypothetical protein